MSHDIPDQNQHATGDAIAHLLSHTPAVPLMAAVARYMRENTNAADRVFFASCVAQSLKEQTPTATTTAALNAAERIHADLFNDCNGYTSDNPNHRPVTDWESIPDTPTPATVHAAGVGVPVRACPACGDDSADQTGDCAAWCSPECADGNPSGRFDAITADDEPEYERRQAAAVRAINAAVNMGHTSFQALFLKWEFVACPTCGCDLDLESEDGFQSEVRALCDCFGEVVL